MSFIGIIIYSSASKIYLRHHSKCSFPPPEGCGYATSYKNFLTGKEIIET